MVVRTHGLQIHTKPTEMFIQLYKNSLIILSHAEEREKLG